MGAGIFSSKLSAAYVYRMTDIFHIHADGSFDIDARTGGWAFVVHQGHRQIYATSGKAAGASNNRFEVLAALHALTWVAAEAQGHPVTLWTDSRHVVEGCIRWRAIWRNNGWKRITANAHARRRAIPDADIWQRLDSLLERCPQVTVEWCKGHAGATGNELADRLARYAAR